MKERKENISKQVEFSYSGDIELLMNLHRKNQMLNDEDNRHKQIRTGIIFMGGGQLGAIHAGIVQGILDYHLEDCFDYSIGSSAGAVAAVHLVTQEAYKGGSIIWEDNTQTKAISIKRPHKIMDSSKFEKPIRETKRANYTYLQNSRTKVLIGITDYIIGKPLFVNPTGVKDPADYLLASACNVSFNRNKPYYINHHPYSDGTLSSPLPISYALLELKLNNILVIMTRNLTDIKSKPEHIFNTIYGLNKSSQKYYEEIAYLNGERNIPIDVNVGAIYPTKINIHNATNDKEKLINVSLEARWFMQELFKSFQF